MFGWKRQAIAAEHTIKCLEKRREVDRQERKAANIEADASRGRADVLGDWLAETEGRLAEVESQLQAEKGGHALTGKRLDQARAELSDTLAAIRRLELEALSWERGADRAGWQSRAEELEAELAELKRLRGQRVEELEAELARVTEQRNQVWRSLSAIDDTTHDALLPLTAPGSEERDEFIAAVSSTPAVRESVVEPGEETDVPEPPLDGSFAAFRAQVEAAGLTARSCSVGHWQIDDGETLVHVWPFGERGFRMAIAGQHATAGTIEEAIEMARRKTVKLKEEDEPPTLSPYEQFAAEVEAAGLTAHNYGDGDWQIRGGLWIIAVWPEKQGVRMLRQKEESKLGSIKEAIALANEVPF